MRKIYLVSMIILSVINTAKGQFQQEKRDTILTNVDLNEIVVKAPEIVNKNGEKMYFPTSQQKRLSNNGLALLEKMQLNGLQVNSLFSTVNVSGGGNATFCIDGRIVDLTDVLALKPSQISRIVYNDNPGARFKDSAVVINYILKKSQQGGNIMTDLMEAVNTTYGRNHVSGKYNLGHSEWSLNYNQYHASFTEFHNQKTEFYHFTDKKEISQVENGEPGRLKYAVQNITANYNYLLPDKWMLNIALRGLYNDHPKEELNSTLHNSNYPDLFWKLQDYSKEHIHSQAMDIYLQRNLPKGQNLYLNLVGTYIDTNNSLIYNILNNNDTINHFFNNVKGNKYSLIGEVLYEKKAEQGKWTIGYKHQYGYASNEYSGTTVAITRLHDTNSYLYAEYQRTFPKWNYSLGIGTGYSAFSQSDNGYHQFTLRPTFQVSYSPWENFQLRNRSSIENLLPDLSQLSDVEQTLDNYQILKGNPNLRPVTEYKTRFTLDYRKSFISTALNISYSYRNHPIMDESFQRESNFIRTYNNQTSWQKFNSEYEIRLNLLRGAFTFRGAVGFDYYDSKAPVYHHSFSNFYGIINTTLAYKFCALTFDLTTHRPSLLGETLILGEDLHDIALTYFKKNYSISLAMNNPFLNNYKIGSKNFNKQAPYQNYQYINETSKMFLVKWTWNLDLGRNYKAGKQRLQNEDNDSGVVKSNK